MSHSDISSRYTHTRQVRARRRGCGKSAAKYMQLKNTVLNSQIELHRAPWDGGYSLPLALIQSGRQFAAVGTDEFGSRTKQFEDLEHGFLGFCADVGCVMLNQP